jgi:hypothetical protein
LGRRRPGASTSGAAIGATNVAKMPLTPIARERKLRRFMKSHTHHFATAGTTRRPTMLLTGTRSSVSPSIGCESLEGESVT